MLHNHLFMGFLVISSMILLTACKPSLSIDGLDKETWVADKFACIGNRFEYLQLIDDNRKNLLRLDQNEVKSLLGPPDEHELDKRKRKYFHYYLQPGVNCKGGVEHPVRLQIRFNALGLSSEVFLENY